MQNYPMPLILGNEYSNMVEQIGRKVIRFPLCFSKKIPVPFDTGIFLSF